jgi:hypothetical protein
MSRLLFSLLGHTGAPGTVVVVRDEAPLSLACCAPTASLTRVADFDDVLLDLSSVACAISMSCKSLLRRRRGC